MTFLNPLALLGLAAAAIPILLHILTLRRLRVVEFSTLRFLKELQRSTIRRLRLRQWLLLFLRTLFVVLLALAFSRPALRGAFGFAPRSHSNTTAVIILDDSPSMSVSGEAGEAGTRARVYAQSLIDLFEDGDEVALFRTSSDVPTPTRAFEAVLRDLDDPRSRSRSATLEDAIRSAARLLSASQNANKEIFIFSDAQASRLSSTPAGSTERLFDERTRAFVRRISTEPVRNVSIEDVRLPDAIREPGRPLTVRIRVRNHGSEPVSDYSISLFIEGTRVAQRGIDLAAGTSAEVEVIVQPKRPGFLRGVVELEDDALAFDDRRAFTCFIPDRLHLLLVGTTESLRYLRLALETRLSDSVRPVILDQAAPERISSTLTPATQTVVLSNVGALDPSAQRSLAAHLERGGGILIFPGPDSNAPGTLPDGVPQIQSIEQIPQGPGLRTEAGFERIDWLHPILKTIFEPAAGTSSRATERRTIPLPNIRTFARVNARENAIPVMSFTGGIPFLVESRVRAGRVLVFTAGAMRAWSDFPLSPLFAPLVRQSAAYVSGDHADEEPVLVGEPATMRLRQATSATVRVIDPLGAETIAAVTRLGENAVVALPSTDIPGIYAVVRDQSVLGQVAVVMDPRESFLESASDEDLEALFQKLGLPAERLTVTSEATDLARIVREARFGVELWQWFLIAALVVGVMETLIARNSRRAMAELETNRYI